MTDIADATWKLTFWTRVLRICTLSAVLIAVAYLAFAEVVHHMGWPVDRRLPYLALEWVILGPVLMLRQFSRVQLGRAIDTHPLLFLALVEQEFGGSKK